MKASIQNKLEFLVERREELSHLLSDPDIIRDQTRFRELSKEYSELEPLVLEFRAYQNAKEAVVSIAAMLKDADPEIRALAQAELADAKMKVDVY